MRHLVRAAAVPGEQVLRPFDDDIFPEGGAEHVQFRAAEVLTRRGRDADRTMVLHEHDVTFFVVADLGQVALVGADARQRFHACAQRPPFRDRPAIRRELGLRARVDDSSETVLAQRAPHRIEQIDGEIVVMVGEEIACKIGERPHVRGSAAPGRRSRGRGYEPVRRERVEVLAHRGFGEPERRGKLARRRLRALEPVDDTALCVTEFACAGRIGRDPIGLDGAHHKAHYRKYRFA